MLFNCWLSAPLLYQHDVITGIRLSKKCYLPVSASRQPNFQSSLFLTVPPHRKERKKEPFCSKYPTKSGLPLCLSCIAQALEKAMVNHKIHKAQSCLWSCSSVFKVQDKRLIEWPLPCFLSSLQFQELFFSMLGGIWLLLVKNDTISESQNPGINRKNKPKPQTKWQWTWWPGELLTMTASCLFTRRIQFAENNAWRICMQAVSEGRLTQWLGLHEEADSLRSDAFLRRKSRTSAII